MKPVLRHKIVFGTPKRFYVNDTEVTEGEYRERTKSKPVEPGDEVLTQSTTGWADFTSEALAVHPDQVGEANERAKRHGLGTKYDRNGFAHIPDRADRKRLLRLEGMHDNHGGYGD